MTFLVYGEDSFREIIKQRGIVIILKSNSSTVSFFYKT